MGAAREEPGGAGVYCPRGNFVMLVHADAGRSLDQYVVFMFS